MLRAWIPAFAGMTVMWLTAAGVPDCYGLRPGLRRADGNAIHRDGVPIRYGPGPRRSPG